MAGVSLRLMLTNPSCPGGRGGTAQDFSGSLPWSWSPGGSGGKEKEEDFGKTLCSEGAGFKASLVCVGGRSFSCSESGAVISCSLVRAEPRAVSARLSVCQSHRRRDVCYLRITCRESAHGPRTSLLPLSARDVSSICLRSRTLSFSVSS